MWWKLIVSKNDGTKRVAIVESDKGEDVLSKAPAKLDVFHLFDIGESFRVSPMPSPEELVGEWRTPEEFDRDIREWCSRCRWRNSK